MAQGDHGPKDRMYRTAESEVLIEHWTTRVYFWAKGRRATAAWLLVRGVVHAARHREATEVELVVPVDKFSAVGRMSGLIAFMSRQAEFHDWVCVGSTRFFLRPQERRRDLAAPRKGLGVGRSQVRKQFTGDHGDIRQGRVEGPGGVAVGCSPEAAAAAAAAASASRSTAASAAASAARSAAK